MPYNHLVFTLPDIFIPLSWQNKRLIYNLLFKAASKALLTTASDDKYLGADIGAIGLLDTAGQTLITQIHLHFLAPSGGISRDGQRWIESRNNPFLPVDVLTTRFQSLFLRYLSQSYQAGELQLHGLLVHLTKPTAWQAFIEQAQQQNWDVYIKEAEPEAVLQYLAKHCHSLAIDNYRLKSADNGKVTFTLRNDQSPHDQESKDPQHKDEKLLTLSAVEFIRRWLQHLLPDGFQHIRYFGGLANRQRAAYLARCRELLNAKIEAAPPTLTLVARAVCPNCRQGRLKKQLLLQPQQALLLKARPAS